MIKNRRGQSTLEYALIIAVVVGALLAMQVYMKRSLQGKLRESTDEMGGQYSAGNVTAKYITTQNGQKVTTEKFGVDSSGKSAIGVSRTEVDAKSTAVTTTEAAGANAEKINKTFQKELEEEGLTPKQ